MTLSKLQESVNHIEIIHYKIYDLKTLNELRIIQSSLVKGKIKKIKDVEKELKEHKKDLKEYKAKEKAYLKIIKKRMVHNEK